MGETWDFIVFIPVSDFSCGLNLNAAADPADTIKIGLLIPTNNPLQPKVCRACNTGGKEVAGRRSLLQAWKVRDMEGPWGTGSKVMVDLVFNAKSLGRAWLREWQEFTRSRFLGKSHVVFLNALSGDPTLSGICACCKKKKKKHLPWHKCLRESRVTGQSI